MKKPKKYFNNCNQEYVYAADPMDTYLNSLKVDREILDELISLKLLQMIVDNKPDESGWRWGMKWISVKERLPEAKEQVL